MSPPGPLLPSAARRKISALGDSWPADALPVRFRLHGADSLLARPHRQRLQSAHAEAVEPDGRRGARCHVRDALDQRRDRYTRLESRKLRAETEMRALAEGQMTVRLARDIDLVGIGE